MLLLLAFCSIENRIPYSSDWTEENVFCWISFLGLQVKCKVCADEIEKYIYKCTLAPFTKKTGLCVLSHVCIMYACMYYWKEKKDVWKGKELKWLRGLERERKTRERSRVNCESKRSTLLLALLLPLLPSSI